jgi:hypothetical protein
MEVVPEERKGHLLRREATAEPSPGLDYDHVETRAREVVGTDETIGTTADDDDIDFLRASKDSHRQPSNRVTTRALRDR